MVVSASMKLRKAFFSLWLLFVLGLWVPTLLAQQQAEERVRAVAFIGMTVSDMDRSVEFYSKVLSFQKVFDVEVWGSEYERLQGIFGLH
jgi:glyoxalase/bleomycin resistance protein/dioxygenase superfamily protein